MGKPISISFALNATLGSGFKAVFQSAASSARNVASAIREMEKSPVGHLGAAMAQQREKIKGLAGSLKEAKATLATLQSQAQASGGSTKLLATQIRLAEDRVNNLNGALSRQRSLLLNTAAQAATSGKSIRQLGQEYNNLTQNIERARKAQAAIHANRAQADALRSQRADLNSRLTGAVAAATTVAAPIALSIGFEDQMAKVGAVSRASKEDLALLTEQARQLGRDTSFSASQAAEGMQYLAMAGFKTNQVMAAMPGMLDLAAASGTDLGQTANIASNILSAFELKAEQMGHVGDVLVAAFTSSNTTLESLGETMRYVGPVAKDAGASIEDAVAMAAMLGNVGISGSQAGTASKSIFARLAAPPTEAAKALNALNIQTKDAQGNLRAVPDILEEIILKTASMGTADRTDVFSKVFGLEPMAGASALAKQAAQTVDENGRQIVDSMGKPTTALLQFTDKLKHASDDIDGNGGMASSTAKQMNNTTGGSLRMLSSAWQDVAICVGNLFLPTIRDAAGALSTIANVISATVNRFPLLSKGIALVVGGIIALTAASVAMGLVMNFVRTGLNGFRGGLLRISAASVAATASTTASTAAAGGFGIASRIAGAGAKFFAGGLRSILMATGVGALLVGLGFALNLLIDNWDAVVAAMSQAWAWVTGTWSRLGVFFSELGNNLLAIFPGIWNGICSIAATALDFITSYWSGLASFYSGLWNGICGVFGWARDTVSGIWSGVWEFFGSIGQGISDCFSGVWQGIVDLAAWAWEGISAVWTGAANFFSGIVDSIFGVFTWLFDWLKENFAWVFSTIDAVGSVIGSITGAVKGAWNAAFGAKKDGENAASSAAPAASGAPGNQTSLPTSAAPNANNASDKPVAAASPKYQPVSAQAYHAAFDGKKEGTAKSGGGRGRKKASGGSGASGGGGRSRSGSSSGRKSGAGAGSGPVTVVTLDSGNEIKTQFLPARGTPNPYASTAGNGFAVPAAARNAKPLETDRTYGFGENAAANANRTFPPKQPDTGFRAAPLEAQRPYGAGLPLAGMANAMSALKSSGLGATIGQGLRNRRERSDLTDAASPLRGLQAGIGGALSLAAKLPYESGLPLAGMAKSVLGIGQKPQDSAAAQAAKAPAVQTAILSATPAKTPPVQVNLPAASQVRSGSALRPRWEQSDLTGAAYSSRVLQTSGQPALPQAPAMIAKRKRQKSAQTQPNQQSISIDLTQNFDLITQDAAAARKALEAIRPDMEALIRRALEKINSDRRRTAYAQ